MSREGKQAKAKRKTKKRFQRKRLEAMANQAEQARIQRQPSPMPSKKEAEVIDVPGLVVQPESMRPNPLRTLMQMTTAIVDPCFYFYATQATQPINPQEDDSNEPM